MRKHIYLVLLILFFASKPGIAQNIDSLSGKTENLPDNLLAKIQKKYSSIGKNLSKKTAKYLRKMERQEKKLQRKALKANSGYIPHKNIDSVYSAFKSKLSSGSQSSVVGCRSSVVHLSQYNPFVDTLLYI